MRMRITVDGVAYEVEVEMLDSAAGAPRPPATAASTYPTTPAPPRPAAPPEPPAPRPNRNVRRQAGTGEVCSPVSGTVLSIKVKAGDEVRVNDTLLVLEAMKMESAVASPTAGRVGEVLVAPGDTVTEGRVLVRLV